MRSNKQSRQQIAQHRRELHPRENHHGGCGRSDNDDALEEKNVRHFLPSRRSGQQSIPPLHRRGSRRAEIWEKIIEPSDSSRDAAPAC
jgi:hypothetical protein